MEKKEYRVLKVAILHFDEDVITSSGNGETVEENGTKFSVNSFSPGWLD